MLPHKIFHMEIGLAYPKKFSGRMAMHIHEIFSRSMVFVNPMTSYNLLGLAYPKNILQ